jgi:hypothetical protein
MGTEPSRARERCSVAELFRDLWGSRRDITSSITCGGAVSSRALQVFRLRSDSLPSKSATVTTVAPTRWDVWVFLRALLAAALTLAVAWLATAATDEGGVSWGERAGRTLPLGPACAAIGAGIALAPVRARGETLALAALGRSPAQIAAAAVAGAALVACAGALVIAAVSSVDVTAFFPRASHATTWSFENGSFVDRAQGLRVGGDGAPVRIARELGAAMATIPRHGRAAAATATGIGGLALPLLVAHALLARSASARGRGRDPESTRESGVALLAAAGAIAASVALFQAAAVRQVPAFVGVVPALALLAFGVRRYRASSWARLTWRK